MHENQAWNQTSAVTSQLLQENEAQIRLLNEKLQAKAQSTENLKNKLKDQEILILTLQKQQPIVQNQIHLDLRSEEMQELKSKM